jgi:hypothetical protein
METKNKKIGTKNTVAINQTIKSIEILTNFFKRKRISQDEYIRRVNQKLSSMTSERDYIKYLQNIGQY